MREILICSVFLRSFKHLSANYVPGTLYKMPGIQKYKTPPLSPMGSHSTEETPSKKTQHNDHLETA